MIVNDTVSLSILEGRDYIPLDIKSVGGDKLEMAFMCYCSKPNDEIRTDALYLMENRNTPYIIMKYKGEEYPKKIYSDGSEKRLNYTYYEKEPYDNETYVYEGMSFSFKSATEYYSPKSKNDLKNGMIVEYLNNGVWNKKEIVNINEEWEKMYKLLYKYDRLRIQRRD